MNIFKNKHMIFMALFIFWSPIFCHRNSIIQVSIPKSGTHLLIKCIQLLTKRNPKWIRDTRYEKTLFRPPISVLSRFIKSSENEFLMTHLVHSISYDVYLSRPGIKLIFIYRDPRDVAVSLAFYMKSNDRAKADWPMAQNLSFNELLLDIITEGKSFQHFPPINGGIDGVYKSYLNWLKSSKFLSIKFEDLVGPHGGGSYTAQLNTIKKIAAHLNINLHHEQANQVCHDIFGESFTFREGKIGTWKKYFNTIHINAFKKNTGDLLIELGYENNNDW